MIGTKEALQLQGIIIGQIVQKEIKTQNISFEIPIPIEVPTASAPHISKNIKLRSSRSGMSAGLK